MTKPILLLLIAAVSICAVACSSDNDDNTKNYAKEIAAAYQGYTVSSSQYFQDLLANDQTLHVTANADGTAALTLESSFSNIGPAEMPMSSFTITISIKSADVTELPDGYAVTGTGEAVIVPLGSTAGRTYTCDVEGKIATGKKNASILFTLPSVMGGMNIQFTQGEPSAAS